MVATQILLIFTPMLGEMMQFWVILFRWVIQPPSRMPLLFGMGWIIQSLDGMMRKLIGTQLNLQSIQIVPVICRFCHDLPQWNHESSLHGFFWVQTEGLSKNTVLKIEIPWIYLPNPTPRTVTTRRILDFSRGIPNYKPLFATGCYWVRG